MVLSIKKQIAALAVSALALAPVATGVTFLTAESAFAGPKGNSGGGGDRSSSGRSDRGDRDNGNRGAGRSNDNNRSSNNGNSRSTQTQTTPPPPRTTTPPPPTTTTPQVAVAANGNAYGQRTADEERPGQGAIRSELKGMNAIHSFKDGAFPNAAPGSQVGRLAAYFETAGVTSVAFEDYETALGAVALFEETNPDFEEDLEAQQALSDALLAFDAKYSPAGTSLGIDSLDDAYSYIDGAYGNDPSNPIDTPDEVQAVIDSLDAATDAEQIASLETLKTELVTLEGLDAELELQEEYAALKGTLTVEQCDYQNALDGEGDAFLDASNGRDIDEFSDTTITYLRDTLDLGDTYTYPEEPADCSST